MASSSQMNQQSSLPCPAWVWSNASNVHVAKDRSWFSDDYTPVDSFVTTMNGSSAKVVGIGTVDLPTKVSPTQTGPHSHGNLRLKMVLHVPDGVCNIIGSPILDDYDIITSFSRGPEGTSGSITNLSDGQSVAYFKPQSRFCEVQLSDAPVGPNLGPSPFKSSMKYMLRVTLPDSERRRIVAALTPSPKIRSEAAGPLTSAETAWLKKHYGNEFKFLMAHGLSIYKEDDREEGRTIVRAMKSR